LISSVDYNKIKYINEDLLIYRDDNIYILCFTFEYFYSFLIFLFIVYFITSKSVPPLRKADCCHGYRFPLERCQRVLLIFITPFQLERCHQLHCTTGSIFWFTRVLKVRFGFRFPLAIIHLWWGNPGVKVVVYWAVDLTCSQLEGVIYFLPHDNVEHYQFKFS